MKIIMNIEKPLFDLRRKQTPLPRTWVTALVVASLSASIASDANEVVTKGLSPATNTYRAFQDASIARDSQLNKPIDLLNDFYPSIQVTISDHGNIRRRTDLDEADTRMAISPSLAYRTDLGRHPFYVAYNGTYTYHSDFETEDAQSHNLSSNLSLDISHMWDLDLFGSIGTGFEERGISGSRSLTGRLGEDRASFSQVDLAQDLDKYDYETVGFDLAYGRKGANFTAVAGYERTETEFTNNNQGFGNLTGDRDRESESVHLDLSYNFAGSMSIFGRAQYTEVDYVRSLNSLDHEQTDLMAGLRWNPSNSLSGVVGIGNTKRDFVDPQRSDYSGLNYYANLGYQITDYSSISFAASRFLEEPGDQFADYYESDLFAIAYDHAITDLVDLGLYSKWVDDSYNIGRNDDFVDYGITLDYNWRSWMSLGLFYGEIERDSNESNIAYDDQYFGLRITSDLRGLTSGSKKDKFLEPYSYEEDPDQLERYSRDTIRRTEPSQ